MDFFIQILIIAILLLIAVLLVKCLKVFFGKGEYGFPATRKRYYADYISSRESKKGGIR